MGHHITGSISAGWEDLLAPVKLRTMPMALWLMAASTRLNRLQQRGQLKCVPHYSGRRGSLRYSEANPLRGVNPKIESGPLDWGWALGNAQTPQKYKLLKNIKEEAMV
jgi:hypothetical protein